MTFRLVDALGALTPRRAAGRLQHHTPHLPLHQARRPASQAMRLKAVVNDFASGDLEAFDATSDLAERYAKATITLGGHALIDQLSLGDWTRPPTGVTFIHVDDCGRTTNRWVPYT